MADEATLKKMALEYARRMNAGDVEAVLELFSDDVVFEDPVGAPPLIGKDALRGHIAWSMECQVHEVPGRPVTSMDGRRVVTPTTVTVYAPAKLTFNIIGVIELDDDGLARHAQAFWGITDTKVGDGPELTGVAHFMAVTQNLAKMVQAKGSPSPT
ncbi:nuclear transport factor 2 family protein [Streptomyces sp. NPDC044780]|uniref:Nuclear transport factor 2 family protein n=1 Tax=Streptomyces luomodiensis TaxID=3026192 RepID=A0ABY9URJ5_9ACTN|nr:MULTISPECIES: nuclear transport factor 2 family protein [unclassified Streptomyces]WAP54071.1 nuclear transport factor 2 family protein [Streptomyces sp. S465]WNE94530.1 nuclear transport factor 2 family protein [Streptomyces sp. SCA4-21]